MIQVQQAPLPRQMSPLRRKKVPDHICLSQQGRAQTTQKDQATGIVNRLKFASRSSLAS